MNGSSRSLANFFPLYYPSTAGPKWLVRLMIVFLCCYPFIGARFLPLGDSGRFLSVLIAPVGLLYLVFFARTTVFTLFLDATKRLWVWLPFFLSFGIISWIHPYHYNWGQLFQKFIFAFILYTCARQLQIKHLQLIIAAAVGAWLYFLCALLDAWTFYNPEFLQLQIPRHLTENGLYRVGGGGGNPIHFADACMWLTGICALGLSHHCVKNPRIKLAVLSGAIIVFLVALATQSRGALLALLPLFVLLVVQTKTQYRKYIAFAVFLSLIAAFILATQTEFFHRIKRVFYDLYYYLTEPHFIISSVSARIEMWRFTITTWQDNLLLGSGISNIKDLIQAYPSTTPLHPSILMQPHFHNDWMQSISIGGLLLLTGLFSTFALLLIQSRKDIISIWIILAGLCFGLSDLILYQNTMLTFLISAWALFSASYDNQKHTALHPDHH